MNTTTNRKQISFKNNTHMRVTTDFLKNNVVFLTALSLAILTMFIVTPDKKYLEYIDFKTMACLFCTLAVVGALKNIYFFDYLSHKIIKFTKNLRFSILTIICVTFIASMLIANDMALLTFLPLGYLILSSTDNKKYMAFTFIMQNIAANLGGMLTPFGNPQNIFLYSKFQISSSDFLMTMLLPVLTSILLIFICCMFLPTTSLKVQKNFDKKMPKGKTTIYIILFILSISIVFRTIPYIAGLLIITVSLLFLDRKAIAAIDWGILGTFIAFFIFSGNIARIEIFNNFFTEAMIKNPLITSTALCQIISNVPSSILLSNFTNNWQDLLIGVNIGGTGTLIASLASLITFREYIKHNNEKTLSYIVKFTAFNLIFLLILLIVCSI